ncbi:MAG: serine hydrolase, partial [Bdellovibrionales bacterium]|nr:serine hydrolase [Bdellovibrionales bacterium]
MTHKLFLVLLFLVVTTGQSAEAFPLDAYDETKIDRLEGYYHSLKTPEGKEAFDPGQLLVSREVQLRAFNGPHVIPAPDPALTNALKAALAPHLNAYGVAVLDLSNPARPAYAEINATRQFIPASVGKIVVALAVFNELAKMYPTDLTKRNHILKNRLIVANEYIETDEHEVPFWDKKEGLVEGRKLALGDMGNMWTYLDWMLSASSNASASMLMRELILMRHFRDGYPATVREEENFFQMSTASQRSSILHSVILDALRDNGIDSSTLRQTSLFTKRGKQLIPGGSSTASARTLLNFLFLLEQGKLVDPASSLELKRLLYHTQKRIRYGEAPELDFDAVYYKSGSMYKCRAERGFLCKKYFGNALNLLNSIAIVESPAVNPKHVYLVALSSNLLKKDSSTLHAELAAKIKQVIETYSLDRI